MSHILADFRYACRLLRNNPAFTAVAIATLAVGIGANVAMFSVIRVVLLRPLPFSASRQLFNVWGYYERSGRTTMSLPDFVDFRAQNQVFEQMAAHSAQSFNLSGDADPERALGRAVTDGYFRTLGVSLVHGRDFTAAEFIPGSGHVAVLSERLWARRFNSDRAILGRAISMNGVPFTVIGIAPALAAYTAPAEIWVPLAVDAAKTHRRSEFLRVIGRAKPGVTPQAVQADMQLIAARLAAQYPATNDNYRVTSESMQEGMIGRFHNGLLMLWGAVGFVLLIVCTNLAVLMLGQGAAREKELAIRAAVGAGRGRIVAQLLLESLLLAIIGGVLGIVGAAWALEGLKRLFPNVPRLAEVGIDSGVLLFTLGISLVTGLVFGLLPALQLSKGHLNESLKEGGRSHVMPARLRLRRALVAAQVAICIVLLAGAGLLIRSFHRLLNVDAGFSTEQRVSFRVGLPQAKYDENRRRQFYHALLDRVSTIPGVESAAAVDSLYLRDGASEVTFEIEGQPELARNLDTRVIHVSASFYRTFGVKLVRGRLLAESDTADAPMVAIVNRRFAESVFGKQDPIGKKITVHIASHVPREIVGVVADSRQSALDKEPYAEVQIPCAQTPPSSINVVLKSTGGAQPVISAARRHVSELDPELPLYGIATLDDVLATSVQDRRLNLNLLEMFAGLALLLAAMGMYGVTSAAVKQRTGEIGIRLALGAQARDVLVMFVREGLVLAAAGSLAGLVAAALLTRLISGLLYGVRATDPWTYAGVVVLLFASVLLATLLPARRASRVDPATVLRN